MSSSTGWQISGVFRSTREEEPKAYPVTYTLSSRISAATSIACSAGWGTDSAHQSNPCSKVMVLDLVQVGGPEWTVGSTIFELWSGALGSLAQRPSRRVRASSGGPAFLRHNIMDVGGV